MRCFRHIIDWGEEGWLSNVITTHAYVRVHSHSMRNLLRRGESWAMRGVSSCNRKNKSVSGTRASLRMYESIRPTFQSFLGLVNSSLDDGLVSSCALADGPPSSE